MGIRLLLLVSILLSGLVGKAQEPLWASASGGSGEDIGRAIAGSPRGITYVAGSFNGSANLGGPSAFTSAGSSDVCLVKYNRDGLFQWARTFGGTGADVGTAVAIDASENVVVSGTFTGTFQFPNSTIRLTSKGGTDIFIARYSAAGTLTWAQSLGGPFDDFARGLGIDRFGNLAFTGAYTTMLINGIDTIRAKGDRDILIAKYRNNGVLEWVKSIGNRTREEGQDAAIDPHGNIYATGFLSGGGLYFEEIPPFTVAMLFKICSPLS